MQSQPEFATRRRVGCVMWLAIVALVLSVLSLLADFSQEIAWSNRTDQPVAVAPQSVAIATDVVAATIAPPSLAQSVEIVPPAGPTYAEVCDIDEDALTAVQLQQHADRYADQAITGWLAYVYDVRERGDSYRLELSSRERGFLWSRNIVIDDLPDSVVAPLSVEQPVLVSGRIAEVGVFMHGICNPVTIAEATITPQ